MKRIIFVLLVAWLFNSNALRADSGYYIVKFNTEDIYSYDNNGEELGKVSRKKAKKAFKEYVVDGAPVSGIKVLEIDQGEGLVLIELPDQAAPVWVEIMSVQLWPDENKLECDDMQIAHSQAEVAQSGMTIGFGDHCK